MTVIINIEVEAFKAFTTRTSLPIDVLPAGLHLVRGRNLTNDRLGSNGSGKSSFFSDAITWCLYGRTVGGLRTTEIQSWLTDAPPWVVVKIKQGEKKHIIIRGPKASALTIDENTVGQEDVDALVGLDYAAWCQAVIWGQGMPLFFDLAPAAKMGLLSDALGLERWERRAQAAGTRAKRLEDRLRGLEGEITGLSAALGHAQNTLEAARDASNEWGRGQAARIEETASVARAARIRADAMEAKRGEAALKADSAGTAAKMLRPDVEAARDKLTGLLTIQGKHAYAIQNWTTKLKETTDQLRTFQEEGACPTCGQAVNKKDVAKHARELLATQTDAKKQQVKSRQAHDIIEKEIFAVKIRFAEDKPRLQELEEGMRRAESELRLLNLEFGNAQAKASAAWEEAQRAEAEINPHREAAQKARTRLREVEREIKEKEKLNQQLAASVERAQFWARGFRDIRLGIIDDILDDLRGTTAEVLDGLGLGEWGVDYITERETKSGTTQRALTVTVRSPTAPAGVRWETYSGGERQRLRLAGALALSEVLMAHAGVTLDFRVLDEPTRGLSHEGVQDLVEVLRAYAEAANLKIFFIDHLAVDGTNFSSTITIENSEHGAVVKI